MSAGGREPVTLWMALLPARDAEERASMVLEAATAEGVEPFTNLVTGATRGWPKLSELAPKLGDIRSRAEKLFGPLPSPRLPKGWRLFP